MTQVSDAPRRQERGGGSLEGSRPLTYCDRILWLLGDYNWHNALALLEVGGLNYRRRISDLRLLGHVIEDRIEVVDHIRRSYYRMIEKVK